MREFELYLDESGDFNEGKEGHEYTEELSMVSGLLCDPAVITRERINATFPHGVHACNKYSKSYLHVLQELRRDGCAFVVFENQEQIRVINSNYTYINIIAEGLARLFRDLSNEYPEGVRIHVVIAQRQMELHEYRYRVREKTVVALGRREIEGVNYDFEIADARTDKRLFYADIICNTWLTRNRKNKKHDDSLKEKFTDEERELIREMYDRKWIYSVFEDATTTLLKQLIEERHLGEAMLQISALPKQSGFVRLRSQVIKEIEKAGSYEQDTWFNQMSLMIGQLNHMRRYSEAIRIAENYRTHFLNAFSLEKHLKTAVPYWRFDTNFYLLTIYDHLGNIAKCQELLSVCRESIAVVNRSWEHIDYYFRFCIRELMVLMNQYAFEEVIKKAKELEKVFIEARELFGIIKTYNGTEQPVRSELLGKTYGVQLQALINLLHKRPELFDEALHVSDLALAEFEDPRDISRQMQWRCMLYEEAGRVEEAYAALLQAVGLPMNENAPQAFLDYAYSLKPGAYDYLLWHYTNVMLRMKEQNHPIGEQMGIVLSHNTGFSADVKDKKKTDHPWNLIFWNVARYARLDGNLPVYKGYYRHAMEITRSNPANVTMMTFALSMSADRLLWCREHGTDDVATAEKEFKRVCIELITGSMTGDMKIAFGFDDKEIPSDSYLMMIALAYLK